MLHLYVCCTISCMHQLHSRQHVCDNYTIIDNDSFFTIKHFNLYSPFCIFVVCVYVNKHILVLNSFRNIRFDTTIK